MTRNRVALMRRVRRMLRAGFDTRAIIKALGATSSEIATQRRLMSLCAIPNTFGDAELRSFHHGAGGGRTAGKAAAEMNGADLCQIFAAPATSRQLAYWMRGD